MTKNKVKIYTLGCKVNQYDSANLKEKLKSFGFNFVEKNADFSIVNTCAVTKTAISKDKRLLSKAKKENPKSKIFLIGCFSKVYKKDASRLDADYIYGVRENDKVVKKILEISKTIPQNKNLDLVCSSKSRYFIKIQDGCEQFCSYCIIPYTRGSLRSRNSDDILREITEAVRVGFREIVLTGIHLGLYGFDKKNNDNNLTSLIKEVIKIKNLGRIRLSSIEITEVSDQLIDLINKEKKVCKHLHIPLQSGSDKVLKLMNRPYDRKYFLDRVRALRKLIPDISITTDIIVGFPGEGKREFKEAYDFVKKVNFSRLHVFPFSAHELTPAYNFPDQVKEEDKKTRARELRVLSEKLENDFKSKFKGRELEVVIENTRLGKCIGRSEYYFDIKFIKGNHKIKELVKIKNR